MTYACKVTSNTCCRRICDQKDGLDSEYRAIEESKKFYEDATGGLTVFQMAHRLEYTVCFRQAREVPRKREARRLHFSLLGDRGSLYNLRLCSTTAGGGC